MKVAFFLTPKSETVWLPETATLRQAFERMNAHGYTAIPLLDDSGGYVGTLTEGDILRHALGSGEKWLTTAEGTLLRDIRRRTNNRAVHIDAEVETLIARAVAQNFVPVVDDRDIFIGIATRRLIMEHLAKRAGVWHARARASS
ncbi:MAG TPA: CBS domain-containing protein [Polyangiaceae bacterium]|nr:CBS domain-containing protein [Polyangiaceae bacterium]